MTRYLRFARSLALVTGPLAVSCGGAQPAPASPAPLASAQSSTTVTNDPPPPPVEGDGPCRCSWDRNQQAAPRVCKRGQIDYQGKACLPPGRDVEEWNVPVKGPLPPPELPRRRRAAKPRAQASARSLAARPRARLRAAS